MPTGESTTGGSERRRFPEREKERKLAYNKRQYEKQKARLALISGTQHTLGS